MGLMVADFRFDDRVPSLPEICEAVTAISSLPVRVLESEPDELHDLHATIAFEGATEVTLQLAAYRRGAVDRFCDNMVPDAAHTAYMKQVAQGANEPAGTQTVHLRGYLGEERTLMVTAQLALDSLGGTSLHPMPEDDRREFGQKITPSELSDRRRKAERDMRKMTIITILLLPVLIPLWALDLLWFILRMPFRMWRGARLF